MQTVNFRIDLADGSTEVHCLQWGDPTNSRLMICAHGLTRNARDFDFLARTLAVDYRVICIDFPGRGGSAWLTNKLNYTLATYVEVSEKLLQQLHAHTLDWIGTSMGGLIGMSLAAIPETPIQRLVVNDVGPVIPATALARIASYIGLSHSFETLQDLEDHLRQVHAPFGRLSDAHWQHLAQTGHRVTEDGRYACAYDPGIALPFTQPKIEDMELWSIWNAIQCPTLVLRGAESDLLSADTAAQMQQHGLAVTLVEFEGVGHAPALMAPEQINVVCDWLNASFFSVSQ